MSNTQPLLSRRNFGGGGGNNMIMLPAPIGDDTPLLLPESKNNTTRVGIIVAIIFLSIVGVVLGATALGLFVPFRDETNAHLTLLDATSVDNVGTLGVGPFRDKTDNTFHFHNVAPGVHTTVVLDVNDNIVVDVNAASLGTIEIITTTGLMGGQIIPLGGSATLSLTAAQSFSMLAVSGSTMLGTETSCIQPLLPSCYNISNQGCSTPLLPSCFPSALILDTLTVNNLIILNTSTIIDVILGGNVSNVFDNIYITNEYLTGSMVCSGMGQIDQGCLNLGGYSCPLGVPLADSCFPASMVFYNESVTNLLSVNQVECLGGPLPDACVGGTSLATAGAIVRRNSSAGFAAGFVTMDGFGPTNGHSSVLVGGGTLEPSNGVVYLLVQNGYFQHHTLYRWNYYTNALTNIGALGHYFQQIFFDSNGVMYGHSTDYFVQTNHFIWTIDPNNATATQVSSCNVVSLFGGFAFADDNVNVYALNVNASGANTYDLILYNIYTCTSVMVTPQIFTGMTLAQYTGASNLPFIDMFRQNGNLYITITDETFPPPLTNNVGRPSLLLVYNFATASVTTLTRSNLQVLTQNFNPPYISATPFCSVNGPLALQLTTSPRYFSGASINSLACLLDPDTGLTDSCLVFPLVGNMLTGNVNQVTAFGSFCPPTQLVPTSMKLQGDIDANAQYSINNAKRISAALITTGALGTSSLQTLNGTDMTMFGNSLFIVNYTYGGSIQLGYDTSLYRASAQALRTDSFLFVRPPLTTNAFITALSVSPQLNLTTTGASLGTISTSVTNTIVASQGSTHGVLTFSVNAAGSGYVVGDIVTVTGGSGTATLTVTTVSGPGGILTLSLTRPGSGYSVTSGVTVTGGTGTMATINILSIGTATYAMLTGVQAQGVTASGVFSTATVNNAVAFQVADNIVGSGPIVIVTQIGLDVPSLATASTNAYGIRVGAPTGGTSINNALNFRQSTTAAGGITFGTDANLYRSAVGMIKSDTDVTVRHMEYANVAIPTVVAGPAAGTSPTITVTASSTDCKMQITVLTGSGPANSDVIMTVTYNTAFTSTAKGVVFSAANANTAALGTNSHAYISSESTSSFALSTGTVGLVATTTYVWNFLSC